MSSTRYQRKLLKVALIWAPSSNDTKSGNQVLSIFQSIIQRVKTFLNVTEKRHPDYTVSMAPPTDHYQVMRDDMVGNRFATTEEVSEFLQNCHMEPETPIFEAAMAGLPFEIDGATMRFVRLPEGFVPPVAG